MMVRDAVKSVCLSASWPGKDPAIQGPYTTSDRPAALDGRAKPGHDECSEGLPLQGTVRP